jgi:hypothetical protein
MFWLCDSAFTRLFAPLSAAASLLPVSFPRPPLGHVPWFSLGVYPRRHFFRILAMISPAALPSFPFGAASIFGTHTLICPPPSFSRFFYLAAPACLIRLYYPWRCLLAPAFAFLHSVFAPYLPVFIRHHGIQRHLEGEEPATTLLQDSAPGRCSCQHAS